MNESGLLKLYFSLSFTILSTRLFISFFIQNSKGRLSALGLNHYRVIDIIDPVLHKCSD